MRYNKDFKLSFNDELDDIMLYYIMLWFLIGSIITLMFTVVLMLFK